MPYILRPCIIFHINNNKIQHFMIRLKGSLEECVSFALIEEVQFKFNKIFPRTRTQGFYICYTVIFKCQASAWICCVSWFQNLSKCLESLSSNYASSANSIGSPLLLTGVLALLNLGSLKHTDLGKWPHFPLKQH